MKNEGLESLIKSLLACDQCGETFDDKNAMKHHLLTNHSQDNFKCDLCEKDLETLDNLKEHITFEHRINTRKENLWRRLDDLMTKTTKQKVKLHESIYKLKQRELQVRSTCFCKGLCLINHQKFRWISPKSDNFFKQTNLNNHTKVFKNKFQCSKCEKIFQEEESLKKHVSLYCDTSVKDQCSQCGNSFDDAMDFECHMKIVHISVSDQTKFAYLCKICDGEFDGEKDLEYHNKIHHQQNHRNLCMQCDEIFVGEGNLAKHIESHHRTSVNFKCQPCDEGFPDEISLITHMNGKHST